MYINFNQLKQDVSIVQVAELLEMKLNPLKNQFRARCPLHQKPVEDEETTDLTQLDSKTRYKLLEDLPAVITPDVGRWYCFSCKVGGDCIHLYAQVNKLKPRQAAKELLELFKEEEDGLKPLTYLQPTHDYITLLGFTEDTCKHFGCGYAPKGIMKGTIAVAVRDAKGKLVAYCGCKPQEPTHVFPKDFNPENYIFNAHRVFKEDYVYVLKNPLAVIDAYQRGIENCISFLTHEVSKYQVNLLLSYMERASLEFVAF